jgi:deoxyuridine 5'-triphosphate nucleotidohydrolase
MGGFDGLDGLGFDPEILNDIQNHFKKIQEESGVEIDEDDEYQKELEELIGMTYEEMNEDALKAIKTKNLKVELLNEDAKFPEYAYPSDSGFDLFSTEEVILPPFGRGLVPTGIKLSIPDEFEIQVRPKSGLAINQGLTVLNTPGTVDCFSEDMKILTVDGEKLLSELKINDVVFSVNEKTFEIEKDVVSNIFDTETQEVLIIETELGVLEVTPNSEVYTTNGIILAKNLKENDEIIIF